MYLGGCECGAIRYRLTAEPIFVNCCHCRECQKITGSAFAINALVESDRVEIQGGEAELSTENGVSRCARCKSLLWAEHREFGGGIKFLRVGTLDQAERISPTAHFFTRSKHPWIVVAKGVPAFEALPTNSDSPLMTPESKARLEAARD